MAMSKTDGRREKPEELLGDGEKTRLRLAFSSKLVDVPNDARTPGSDVLTPENVISTPRNEVLTSGDDGRHRCRLVSAPTWRGRGAVKDEMKPLFLLIWPPETTSGRH